MKNLAKTSIVMMAILLVSKFFGFLRDVLLANKFGTSAVVDAYSVACILPTVMFTILASGFNNSFIPVFVRLQNEEDKGKLFSNAICVLGICAIVLSFCCYSFSTSIVSAIAPGFYGETASLTALFVEIIIFYLPFYTVFSIFCAKSSADEDFIFVSFSNNIIVNFIILISIVIASTSNYLVLAYGYVASIMTATIFLGIRIKERGQKFFWCFQPKDSTFRLLASLALPMGLSSLGNQVNTVVDKMFSSTLGEGVTSALVYADHLQLIPYSLIVSVIISVCNPRMNKFFAEGNKEQGLYYARKAMMLALYISIPLVVFLLVYSVPLVDFLMKRGEFGNQSVLMTSSCLLFYSFGIPFYAIRQIATYVLMANLKQGIVLKNTIINTMLNIVLNFVFVNTLGYSGLALATSLAGVVSAICMLMDLKQLNISILRYEEIKDGGKIICSSIISIFICIGIVCIYPMILIKVRLLLLAFVMWGVYFVTSSLLNTKIQQWGCSSLMTLCRKSDSKA